MMRSLYSGVAGLQNHQVRMDVLGNNIANVNTTGFKKGRVNFQDMLSQTQSGAAKPTDEVGGVNPKQVGLGMTIAAIDTIHTQGSLQTTGVMTDLAVQGEGFFIQKASDKQYYTRAGAFGLDENGKLVNPANGMRIQGWLAQQINGNTIINTASELQDLEIPVGGKDPARATENVFFTCNLDKRTPVIPPDSAPGSEDVIKGTWTTSFEIFDSFGRAHKLAVNFSKVNDVANRWRAEVQIDPGTGTNATPRLTTKDAGGAEPNVFYLDFDNLGALKGLLNENTTGAATGNPGDVVDTNIVYNVPDTTTGAGSTQTFRLRLGQVGSYKDSVTQFGEKSSTKITQQDGYTMGYLESFKIDQSGVITGVYTNGTNRALGQVALASFTNPGGLEKAGENTYVVSNNSGAPKVGEVGVAGKGKIIAGALEMSNVDLAEQFTDMIVTQRGFQASSRTITTADQMLQELLSLKR